MADGYDNMADGYDKMVAGYDNMAGSYDNMAGSYDNVAGSYDNMVNGGYTAIHEIVAQDPCYIHTRDVTARQLGNVNFKYKTPLKK